MSSSSVFQNTNISLDSPVFVNKITTPIVYGGTSAISILTLNGTSSGTTTSSCIILQPTGGKVGIGTTTPAYNLDVLGTSRLNSPVFTTKITTPIVYGGTGSTSTLTLKGTSNAVVTGSTVLLQPTGGSVGIGTTTIRTGAKLDVCGNIYSQYGFHSANQTGNDIFSLERRDNVVNASLVISAFGGIGLKSSQGTGNAY